MTAAVRLKDNHRPTVLSLKTRESLAVGHHEAADPLPALRKCEWRNVSAQGEGLCCADNVSGSSATFRLFMET